METNLYGKDTFFESQIRKQNVDHANIISGDINKKEHQNCTQILSLSEYPHSVRLPNL